AGGTTDFNPPAVFGTFGNAICFGDDQFNDVTKEHDIRAFPAKKADGTVIPHTWLITLDALNDPTKKNYDYQDQVMLLQNADPNLTPAMAIGPGTTLDFSSSIAGTVLDGAGRGTGFTSVMPNKNNNQYLPGNLALDTTAGTLR